MVCNASSRGGVGTWEVWDLHDLHLGSHAEVWVVTNVFYESLMDSMSVNDAVHDVHWGTWGGEARHLSAEGALHAVCVPCVIC